ncbi:MAG TPA: zinc ribbon domain-containing protein [Paenibacillus sp.]
MSFIKRIKDGANRATERAQSAVEVSKINGHIAEIEKEMDLHFLKMGKVFYEGYCSEDMRIAEKEMVALSKTCDQLKENIDELRGRIADLKNERLCKCGKVVALEVNFCPYCGTKMSEDQPKQQQENEVYGEKRTIYPEPMNILAPESLLYEDDEELFVVDDVEDVPQDLERERRQVEGLERERERQLELDRRIRYWNDNNHSEDNGLDDEEGVDKEKTFKCQICTADLTLGSKWCPRCGAEQI